MSDKVEIKNCPLCNGQAGEHHESCTLNAALKLVADSTPPQTGDKR